EQIDQRVAEHKDANSRYTSHFSDWKVVYQKGFQTKREALIEEKRIKRLNRESLLRLVFL
ncbi:MAG: GIY-YIG nuclease family protein, partial [Chitinophagales bacterium]